MLIDASFREESRRRLFLDAARRWGVAGCMLLCRADADVVRRRLAHRRGDASDAGWAIYQEAARRWEEPERRHAGDHRRDRCRRPALADARSGPPRALRRPV